MGICGRQTPLAQDTRSETHHRETSASYSRFSATWRAPLGHAVDIATSLELGGPVNRSVQATPTKALRRRADEHNLSTPKCVASMDNGRHPSPTSAMPPSKTRKNKLCALNCNLMPRHPFVLIRSGFDPILCDSGTPPMDGMTETPTCDPIEPMGRRPQTPSCRATARHARSTDHLLVRRADHERAPSDGTAAIGVGALHVPSDANEAVLNS